MLVEENASFNDELELELSSEILFNSESLDGGVENFSEIPGDFSSVKAELSEILGANKPTDGELQLSSDANKGNGEFVVAYFPNHNLSEDGGDAIGVDFEPLSFYEELFSANDSNTNNTVDSSIELDFNFEWFSFLSDEGAQSEGLSVFETELADSMSSSGAMYSDMDVVSEIASELFSEPEDLIESDELANDEDEGVVISFKDSVVTIGGLRGVKANELIYFSGGASGLALNLEYNVVKALIFSDLDEVKTGETVSRSHSVMRIGVGFGVLGRVINPLGFAIDGRGPLVTDGYEPIERKAPGVITRKRINQPLETGLKVVDSLVPIGRGQRELVLGDRKTGKTTIIIDTILNQKESASKMRDSAVCIYVAIGKRMSEMLKICKLFDNRNIATFTTCVFSRSSDPAAMQFIAPYVACTVAEYFTYKGYSAFISYDDLSRHADAYREISLLLRRPVGREAYPGDIFYVHSRLLERAVKLNLQYNSGSLTALPVIETIQGDVASYIPTNVISITDGQIYLSLSKHQEGARPAVDPGLSVSRVGSSAQARMMRRLAGTLKLELAQYREVEQFSKFTSELDDATLQLLEKGLYVSTLLQQERNKPFSTFTQAAMLH